ncbi:glutathione S-transferase [Salmonella enterica subsp. enterica serovar Choleraesuis]|nr:glutathione S-transferase [Salmonella enterica subsp. enterica serovar Choleraesuis]
MKLIGSYTSPYVRKISVILLEQGMAFEFVNAQPWEPDSPISRYNPLGKVPALVDEQGRVWFDSPVIAGLLAHNAEGPKLLPDEPMAALEVRQLEALADGILDVAVISVRERQRPPAHQSPQELVRQREKIERSLDWLEQEIAAGKIVAEPLNIGTIAVGCAVDYLNFRRVLAGWCAGRPHLVALLDKLLQRSSFARTAPPTA